MESKVSVIGAGNVGATCAQRVAQRMKDKLPAFTVNNWQPGFDGVPLQHGGRPLRLQIEELSQRLNNMQPLYNTLHSFP